MSQHDREEARAIAEAHLRDATTARHEGRGEDCCAALVLAQQAAEQAESPALLARVSWRLSKAHFDFGDPVSMMDAIDPLIDDNPFTWYKQGLQAVEPMARRYWDVVGYGNDAVLRLLRAWSQHYREAGDPFLEATGRVQQGWHLACSGNLDGLRSTFQRLNRLTPRDLASSPYRHSDALQDDTLNFVIVRKACKEV